MGNGKRLVYGLSWLEQPDQRQTGHVRHQQHQRDRDRPLDAHRLPPVFRTTGDRGRPPPRAAAVVRTLRSGGPGNAGWNVVVLDGRTDDGAPLESGVYLYEIRAGEQRAVGRFVLIR